MVVGAMERSHSECDNDGEGNNDERHNGYCSNCESNHGESTIMSATKVRGTRGWLVVLALALPTLALARESGSQARGQRALHAVVIGTHEARRRPARSVWDSVYTIEQASRGESTYVRTCARCHGPTLAGQDEAAPLTGGAFLASWDGRTLAELHDRVRTTMPTDTPGVYGRRDITDVIAYVLKFNQFPAGKNELPVGDEELKAIGFVSAKP